MHIPISIHGAVDLQFLRIDTDSLAALRQLKALPPGESITQDSLSSFVCHARDYLCLWRLHSIETQLAAIQSGSRRFDSIFDMSPKILTILLGLEVARPIEGTVHGFV